MKIKKMILIFGFLSILAGPSDANCKDRWTALMSASYIGDIETVQSLIDAGSEVNASSFFRVTALMAASGSGHDEVAKLLIEKGAEVNVAELGGWTPLMYASGPGYIETVKLLIEKGADVHAENKKGETTLMIVEEGIIRRGSDDPDLRKRLEEVVRILKEEEAKN